MAMIPANVPFECTTAYRLLSVLHTDMDPACTGSLAVAAQLTGIHRMKWYRVVSILTVLAFVPGIAAADEGSVYVSVGGLYVMPDDLEMSESEDDWAAMGTLPLDTGPGFTAAIGYGASNGLRAELEIGYRSSSWGKWEDIRLAVDGEPVDTGGLQVEAVKGELTTLSLMANGLMAFDASWGLKPYVGAGIGFARQEASSDGVVATQNGAEFESEGFSDEDTVMAYQAMVGVTYPISENSEARLGYRYFATGEADIDGTKADYGSHNVEVGILFRF